MKSCCGILLFLIFVSCQSVENKGSIVLDLNDTEGTLEYSSFVDSVSYITLRLDEDMYIGKIERIYQRGGFYYVWGSHRSGIYIFDGKGNLYSHIDAYGEGPEHFRDISSFSVVSSTGDVCILDNVSKKIFFYGMNGSFMHNEACPYWSVDLFVPDMEHKIFISPFYAGEDNPKGIWVSDNKNMPLKHLIDDVTSEHMFYYFPMTYNMSNSCIYYYDRNWNYFSAISEKDIDVLYQFELKQKIPFSAIKDIMKDPTNLNGYAVCERFAYSESKVLMLFCRFNYVKNGDERTYVWAVVDNKSKEVRLADGLYNDLDNIQIDNNALFYISDNTWARVLDEDPTNYDVKIQLMHLK